MKRCKLFSVVVAASLASGTALADPDACDEGGGDLERYMDVLSGDRTFVGTDNNLNLGRSVAIGDFNNDTYADLAIGAPGDKTNGGSSGAVYIWFGDMTGAPFQTGGELYPASADVALLGEWVGDRTGWSLANIGDSNLDGGDDLLIGSLPSGGNSGGAGIAHVVLSSTIQGASVIDLFTEADGRFIGEARGHQFGSQVAGVGDINGDFIPDYVISAPNASGRGAVYLWLGGNGLGTQYAGGQEALRFVGATVGGRFGQGVGWVGDIDNDPGDLADIVIGAPQDDTVSGSAGAVYGFPGHNPGDLGSTVLNAPADAFLSLYGRAADRCGYSVAGAGDLDGDDYDELWVGCRTRGSFKEGSAYLIFGRIGSVFGAVRTEAAMQIDGVGSNSTVGTRIVGNVDLNGDSVLDVVISGDRALGAAYGAGAAFAFLGPFNENRDFSTTDSYMAGIEFEDFTGAALAVGDVNGDLYDDIFVGAYKNNHGADAGGLVHMQLGGADVADLATFYVDGDGDGFGLDDAMAAVEACSQPGGYVANNTDCNDGSALHYPGAPETCGDPEDYNCDGFGGDEGDNDSDGYTACNDCNDGNPDVNPGAPEICNGVDDNCDNQTDDETAADATTWYPDGDGDGYGDPVGSITTCEPPLGAGTSLIQTGGDCDDSSASVNPAAPEYCDPDDKDENCDGVANDGDAVDAITYFADADGDTYGIYYARTKSCTQPAGFVANREDCDDLFSDVNIDATETCDFKDNDCDGQFYLGGPESVSRAFTTVLGDKKGDRLVGAGFLPDQDFDGDDELVMVAPGSDVGADLGGAVYIRRGEYQGGNFDLHTVYPDGSGDWDIRIVGTRKETALATSVAYGDINGDLVGDLVLSAAGARVPNQNQGAVYVFYGPIDDGDYTVEDADLTIRGRQSYFLGRSIAVLDFDNDGFDDIAMGEPNVQESLPRQGKVWLLYGRPGMLGSYRVDNLADTWFLGPESNIYAGTVVKNLGDIDGDHADDLGLGTPEYGNTSRIGATYIVYGTNTRVGDPVFGAPDVGLRPVGAITHDARLDGAAVGQATGTTVGGVGDTNGDGLDDFVVGSTGNRAFLIYGSSTRLTTGSVADKAQLRFTGNLSAKVGASVAGLGDLNQDGLDDFAIGAPDDEESDDFADRDKGAVYIVYGIATPDLEELIPAGGLFNLEDLESFGRLPGDGSFFPTYSAINFATLEGAKIPGEARLNALANIDGGGDFDGDGFPDFTLSTGLWARSALEAASGKVYLFLGSQYGTDVFVTDGSEKDWYWDYDADLFTNDDHETFTACEMHRPISFRLPGEPRPRGYEDEQANELGVLDCDDRNYNIYPGAPESEDIDGTDADCDGYDIANILPEIFVELNPAVPEVTDTITAVVTKIDNDPIVTLITYEFKWYVNDSEVSNTSSTITNLYFSKGDTVRVEVRANDTRGLTDWVEDTVTVANSKPYMTECRVTPGTVGVTTDLQVEALGVDDDDDGDDPYLQVEFRWQKFLSPSFFDIPGSLVRNAPLDFISTRDSCLDTYDVSPGYQYNCVRGSRIRAVCRPIDPNYDARPIGYTDYPSDPIDIVNTPPTVETCTVTPSSAPPTTTKDLLAAGTGTDVDTIDTVTVRYEWVVGDVPTGNTSQTLGSSNTSHFEEWYVLCTPEDSAGLQGVAVESNRIIIENTPPGNPAIDLLPDFPLSKDDLFVDILTDAPDVDGDAITYTYFWRRNSAPFDNPTFPTTNSALDDGSTVKGDTWEVTVVASDDYDSGGSDSDSVLIKNTPPTIDGVLVAPDPPLSRDTLTGLAVNFYDYDGDTDRTEFRWIVEGATVAVGPTLAPNLALKGERVQLEGRAYDGEDYGNTILLTPAIVVQNSPPYAVVLDDPSPSPASEFDDIDCNVASAATDFDIGDTVSYGVSFHALRSSNPFTFPPPTPTEVLLRSEVESTVINGPAWSVSSATTQYGDQVFCRVTTYDDNTPTRGVGPTVDSNVTTIQDLTEPPPPSLEGIERYSNMDYIVLSGSCNSFPTECGNLFLNCQDEGGNFLIGTGDPLDGQPGACVETTPGDPLSARFSEVLAAPRGHTYSCYGFCVDIGGNRSLTSNTRTQELCSPYDTYDAPPTGDGPGDHDAYTVGDDPTSAVTLDDVDDTNSAAQVHTIAGNIVGTGTGVADPMTDVEDWFFVYGEDIDTSDVSGHFETYNFEVGITPTSAYNITVYRDTGGSFATAVQQCPAAYPNGYDDYNWFKYDVASYSSSGNPGYTYVRRTATPADNYYPRIQPVKTTATGGTCIALSGGSHIFAGGPCNKDRGPDNTDPTWTFTNPATVRQTCGASDPLTDVDSAYNACETHSAGYYIKVTRPSGTDCTNYEMTIRNGDSTAPGL